MPSSMHQTRMRSPWNLPTNLPMVEQHSACPSRIPTMVFAGSRFAILTAMSCSLVDQGRWRRGRGGFEECNDLLTATINVKSHNVASAVGAYCDSADHLWWPQLLPSKRDYVARLLSLAKGNREPRHLLYGVNVFSRHHGYSNPHSRVSCIKQKILAF